MPIETELLIRATRRGVRDVEAHVHTAAGAKDAGAMSAAIALPLSLMDRALREAGQNSHASEQDFEPLIWVKRDDGFQQMTLHVAKSVRWIFERVPRWLVEVMKREYLGHSWWDTTDEGEVAAMFLQQSLGRVLDHAGWGDNDRLVSEPYFLSGDQLMNLMKFCDRHQLAFIMNGRSHHHPSNTFRLEIFPKVA